jgi:hypothetical protein
VGYDGTQVTEGLRGFHLAIDFNDTYVTIDDVATDVVEGSFLSSVGQTAFFAVQVDANSIVIDGAILGATLGASGAGDLCSITFHGRPVGDGISPVTFVELVVRDPDNMAIPFTATPGQIELDNTPPHVPTLAPEPTYTKGTTNTLYWSDESASGAVGYCCECSENTSFDPLAGTSGCTPYTQFLFVGLEDGHLYYYRVKTRDDLWNVSGWSGLRWSTQDDTAPVTQAGPLAPYRNATTFNIPFTASDATSGVQYVRLFYQRNGGGYSQYNGTYITSPIAFTASGEGVYDFYTIGADRVANIEAPPLVPDCTTEVDMTPPPAVVDFRADPGHNKIHLSWTSPASLASPVEGTLIVRKSWGIGAYPEYDDWGPPAGYPMSPTGGFVVALVPGSGPQTYDDTSFTDNNRNVYYYQAFARDMAGNYSGSAPTARDRSTSYWLADVAEPTGTPGTYDGIVEYYDKIILSYSYSTVEGSPFYVNEMDVGPTDDNSRFGIPDTDNAIEFEDLMIVAMNYGRVNPAGRVVVPVLAGRDVGAPLGLALGLVGGAYEAGGEITVDLTLVGNLGDVKGASVALEYDPLVLALKSVTAGRGLAERSDDVFFYSSPVEAADGDVGIDLALLGTGAAIGGSGTLATLTFDVLSAEPATIGLRAARVRGVENERLGCAKASLSLGSGSEAVAFRLEQNAPNPFNPKTTIAFSIPNESEVSLDLRPARAPSRGRRA